MQVRWLTVCLSLVCSLGLCGSMLLAEGKPLVMVVTDPLSARNACDCVAGYAQRDYDRFGAYLQTSIKQPVEVVYAESFAVALKEKTDGRVDIVVGKDSVIRHDIIALKLPHLKPMASLTDQQGKTTMTGLFVVQGNSQAASLLDLEGYRVFFGPEACDEKWSAPRATLQKLELAIDPTSKSCDTCAVAARELVALPAGTKTAAVISSYAVPLLEGCGKVKKGALRVIGETEAVPFVSCFVSSDLPESQQAAIRDALLASQSPELLKALESKSGFVAYTK